MDISLAAVISAARSYLVIVNYPKIRSCDDLDFRPMTLKFNKFLAVVEIHGCAKFHQAKCSSS